jgi:YbgC/YbaW family acyl-CoA thioester hydrolase
MNDFSMKLELRIDWSELDAFGHVNNLEIMKYVQTARVKYLEKVGLMQLQSQENIGPILASIHCQFRKPLFYPGQVIVRSKVEYIKSPASKYITKSMTKIMNLQLRPRISLFFMISTRIINLLSRTK